jgi:plastocyanin
VKNTIRSLAALLMIFVSWRADATDYYVDVDYYSLSPSTVYIKTGDAVIWVDNDSPLGPFGITGGWGTFFTPNGLQFNVPPGTYNYTAESGFGGGGWNGSVVVQMNFPPSVTITSPTNGAVFTAPAAFSFEADASDPNGDDIMDVEFWVDNEMVDDVYSAPYVTSITNLPARVHTLTAVVWDKSFTTATNAITVNVVNTGPITMGFAGWTGTLLLFEVNGLTPGKTNILECSSNLLDWVPIRTNVPDGAGFGFTSNPTARAQFYRVKQLP